MPIKVRESMNSQFYEFWGNFLTNVGQGQKQIEEMSEWMKRGFAGMDDITALFRRCYGLDGSDAGSDEDPQAWQQAVNDFQSGLTEFAAHWGWVPQDDHQKVLEKCAALEKQVEEQQAAIRQLRDLLAQKGLGHTELLQHMQGALKDQSDQFQALMKSIIGAFEDKSK
jgi:hypothetical protein